MVLVLLLSSCSIFQDDDPEVVAYDDVYEAESWFVTDPGSRTFRDAADWEAFWTDQGVGPAPVVDFGSSIVVAIFWGDRGYAGCQDYAEAIRRIELHEQMLLVDIGPLPDLGACERIVRPLQVVTVPVTGEPVVFTGEFPD